MFIVYLLRAKYCPRLYDYKQVHTQNPCPARVHILAGEGAQWNILVNYRIYKKLKIAREKNQVRGCWGWRVEMGTVILNKAIRNRHWRWKLSKDPKEVNSELCGKHFPCIGNSKCKGTEAGRVTRQGSRKSKEANVNGTEPARERTEYKVRQRLQRGEPLCLERLSGLWLLLWRGWEGLEVWGRGGAGVWLHSKGSAGWLHREMSWDGQPSYAASEKELRGGSCLFPPFPLSE